MSLKGYLLGLAAGLVSAIVFASATTGPLPLRIVLFFIAPLPIYIAGLALGWRAAATAAGSGAVFMALAATSPLAAFAFLACEALPAVALTYLAGLYRDSGPLKGPHDVEWYPIGRIVMWAALIGAGLAMITILSVAGDRDALLASLKTAAGSFISKQMPEGAGRASLDDAELTEIATLTLNLLPAMSAISWTMGHLLNLWLAARVSLASGYLLRPWPDLAATWLPPRLPAVLAASLVATVLADGMPRLIASALTGALFFAYLLQGLAVVHFTTRGSAWRSFVLPTLYAALVLLNAVVPLLVAMLGLAETVRPMRKFSSGPGPAGPSSGA